MGFASTFSISVPTSVAAKNTRSSSSSSSSRRRSTTTQSFTSSASASSSASLLHCSSSSSSSSSFSRRCGFSHKRCLYHTKNATSKVFCSQVKLEDDLDDETCELVNGIELILGEGTDSIRAYLCKAMKNNNGTGVLLLSDIFGFEDSATRDFAYRVGCNGYNVLVPDLFRGDPWTKDRPKSEFPGWVAKQSRERIATDITTSAKWMVDEFIAAKISNKLGIIGFCFGGGPLLETLAQDQGANFGVSACFYGTRMNSSLASDINAPILFISGDSDPLCPVDLLHDMEKTIGRGSKVVVFKGQGHGFAHRPETPEADADAEVAFTILRNWLHDGLVAGKD